MKMCKARARRAMPLPLPATFSHCEFIYQTKMSLSNLKLCNGTQEHAQRKADRRAGRQARALGSRHKRKASMEKENVKDEMGFRQEPNHLGF